MKKIFFTYSVLTASWTLTILYYVLGHNNPELINEFGKKEVDALLGGVFLTSIILTLFTCTIYFLSHSSKNEKNGYVFFHSLLIFSTLTWLGIPWYASVFSLFITYPLFTRFGFHSKHFVYGTTFSYLLLLYAVNGEFQNDSLGFFIRLVFLNTHYAQEQALPYSWIAILVGILCHLYIGKHKGFKQPKKIMKKDKSHTRNPDTRELF